MDNNGVVDVLSEYPSWVCHECALPTARRIPTMATYHQAVCPCCGKCVPVTQPVDYGYPDLVVKPGHSPNEVIDIVILDPSWRVNLRPSQSLPS
jgi:hypothetical protein